jgi:NADP-dependent 3-hydroxy acid dehydrogenase YdfG
MVKKENMEIQDKVAYITGGSKGIGLGVAQVLLNAGMRVAISGRDLKSLQEAEKALGNSEKVFIVVSCNRT